MRECDIVVVGAGVVGLAISYLLSDLNRNIVVIEKNQSFGQESSSRNSEVIHAGLYYYPRSRKVETCMRGRNLLYELCLHYNIPHKKLGKLIVACTEEEVKKIKNINENALSCGVKNLRFLEKDEIKKLEPDVKARLAVYSPDSGIIDSHSLMDFFYKQAKQQGVIFSFSTEVVGIKKNNPEYKVTVKEPNGDVFSFDTETVINAAGFYSDRIAQMVGIDIEKYCYKIHYCKGQYFRIRNPRKFSITHLIYPPATQVSLGIHISPDLAGGLRLGPDAIYVSEVNYNVNEADKNKFFESVKAFLPELEEGDLIPDTAGIRSKLQKETEAFRDFVIEEESMKGFAGFINLIGIESPGLTACLAIAEIVRKFVEKS